MEDMSNLIRNNCSSYQDKNVINRSRGKRDKIVSFPSRTVPKIINSVARSGKKMNPASAAAIKKIAFKSFDKRRAGTNLDRREGSFDDPLSFLRSSSACNKYNNEKVSTGKKSNRTVKTSKQKKVRQSHNAANYTKISSNNAV